MRRLVFLTLLGGLFAYFLMEIFFSFQEAWARALAAGVLLAFFGVILWVFLVFWRSDSETTTPAQRVLSWTAFSAMGFLSFALVLLVARDILARFVAVDLYTAEVSLILLGLAACVFLLGYVNARYGVKLQTVTIRMENLPVELSGLKIVQITDLHVGPTLGRAFAEKTVRLAMSAGPDLIVLTGDLVDGWVRELSDEVAPLSGLRAPLGQYYVPGNHEFYWEGPAWIEKMKDLGFTPLINSNVVLRKNEKAFAIAGVPDPAASMAEQAGPDVERALAAIPGDAFPKIFLCHQPRFAIEAEKWGANLQLSGHTHGGQFFPWTWVASYVHRFNHGLHRLNSMWIYVSRGTGFWGPPVRLGAPAEVTLLVLTRADAPSA